MTEVTQADRDAAASIAGFIGWSGTIIMDMLNGTCEAIPHEYAPQVSLIQTCARHRLASQAAAIRAAIEAGARTGYVTCAVTHHLSLAEKVEQAIRALTVEQIMKELGE